MESLSGVLKIRLEYTEGSSNKFWELNFVGGEGVFGGDYQASWGKIGTSGSSIKYPMGIAQSKLNEKIGKGYIVVDVQRDTHKDDRIYEKRNDGSWTPVTKEKKTKLEFDFLEELSKIG